MFDKVLASALVTPQQLAAWSCIATLHIHTHTYWEIKSSDHEIIRRNNHSTGKLRAGLSNKNGSSDTLIQTHWVYHQWKVEQLQFYCLFVCVKTTEKISLCPVRMFRRQPGKEAKCECVSVCPCSSQVVRVKLRRGLLKDREQRETPDHQKGTVLALLAVRQQCWHQQWWLCNDYKAYSRGQNCL